MSEQRQALRQADRRAPVRKAQPTRQSASGPGDRVASVRDVATFLREDCRTLRDSLQLEMVVAQYFLQMRDVRTPQGVAVGDATSAGVVAEIERYGDPLSHAILRGLGHVGPGEVGARSADAAARLGEHGVGLPAAFGDVGGARGAGAWRAREGGRPGEYALFADFEHPLGSRHSLALFVEPRRGGMLKHIGLMNPMRELELDDPFHPSALEAIEVPAAGALMREVLDRSFGPLLAGADDYRVLIAGARTRSMLQGGVAIGR